MMHGIVQPWNGGLMETMPRWWKAVIVLTTILLLAGVLWYYHVRRDFTLQAVNASLESIAQLQINWISEWRSSRLKEARIAMSSRYSTLLATRWLERLPTVEETEAVLNGWRLRKKEYQYHDALFINATGGIYFRLNAASGALSAESQKALEAAFQKKKPVLSEIYITQNDPYPKIDAISPYFAGENGSAPSGAIIFQYDVRDFLYPMVRWPIPTRSAESVLFRRDGDSICFLNEPRYVKGSLTTFRLQMSERKIPVIRAVMGERGAIQGEDYRGVQVLAVVKSIPDTNWLLIAKEDEAEAFSGLRREFLFVLAAVIFLAASLFTTHIVLWQRNSKAHYRTMFEVEAKRRKSEERYRNTLDSITEGCEIINPEWHHLFVNASAAKHSGHSREELLSQPLTTIFPGVEKSAVFAAFQHCMKDRAPQYIESELKLPSGGLRWYGISVQPIPEGIFVLTTDITERKQAEIENARLQQQFLQSQKMESIGRLAGGIAHDFNNMLGVIIGHAQMALDTINPADPLCTPLQEIAKAARHSADLTRQLLGFARKQTVTPKVLNLNSAIEESLNMLKRLIGEHIDLAWIPDKDLKQVKVDPAQINQILTNLTINARDAIENNGKVTIETGNVTLDETYCPIHQSCVPGEYVMMAVSDNGCGMDKNVLDHIYEPFFTTKKSGEGTGLGLATVYGIVNQNHGCISVYSEPGKGSTFKIYLPQYHNSIKANTEEAGKKPSGGGGETILVVEDEPAVLNLVETMLGRLNYKVIAANTSGEAIQLVQKYDANIHLLLIDVVMPEMTGRELSDQLSSMRPDLKKLFMSGYTADVIAHRGILNEGLHFIQKPFSFKDLAAKVREAIEDPNI
jgi:PAS domain S-box-containing protein